jgi:hypothetical protein
MLILIVLLIGALLVWLASTNRIQTFLDAMANPQGKK